MPKKRLSAEQIVVVVLGQIAVLMSQGKVRPWRAAKAMAIFAQRVRQTASRRR